MTADRWPRLLAVAAGAVSAVAATFVVLGGTAGGVIEGPCQVVVDTAAEQGIDVGARPATPKSAIPVERDETIRVRATSAGFADHAVQLSIAGITRTVDEQADEGAGTWESSVDVADYAWLGVGLYRVSGRSTLVDGTTCTGEVLFRVRGSPFTTVAGVSAALAAGIGAAGAILAGLRPPRLARRKLRAARMGAGGGPGDPAALAAAADQARRWAFLSAFPLPVPIGFAPAVSLTGGLGGAVAGLGAAVLLQQFAVAELTAGLLVGCVVLGVIGGGVVAPTIGRAVAASQVNAALRSAAGGTAPPGHPGAGPTSPPTCRVPAGGLEARDRPHPQAAVTAHLAPGLRFTVVETRADWARLRAPNGWEGWVDARCLEYGVGPSP